MPRSSSLKALCVETVMFIGLFALVGHLSVNFWERHLYQTELASMKCSLHTMKETIHHIGTAYDNLHNEIKRILEIDGRKSPVFVPKEPEHQCKHTCNIDRRKHHNSKAQVMIKANKDQAESTALNEEKSCKNSKITFAYGKNATTITRYPPKSIGVGAESKQYKDERESCCRFRDSCGGKMHRCYKNYEYCGHPYTDLKF